MVKAAKIVLCGAAALSTVLAFAAFGAGAPVFGTLMGAACLTFLYTANDGQVLRMSFS